MEQGFGEKERFTKNHTMKVDLIYTDGDSDYVYIQSIKNVAIRGETTRVERM